MARVLVVGESWFTYTVHQKGFDAFHTAEYTEDGGVFLAALRARGHEVMYEREVAGARVEAQRDRAVAGKGSSWAFLPGHGRCRLRQLRMRFPHAERRSGTCRWKAEETRAGRGGEECRVEEARR